MSLAWFLAGFLVGWCAAMLILVIAMDGAWPFQRRGWRTWRDWTVIEHKRKAWK